MPGSDEVCLLLIFPSLSRFSHLFSICRLLADWIRDYPYDFAVRGTAGALSALVKSIIAKTYLIHYGLEFLPFLETLPNLVDKDASWALKVNSTTEESDDSYSMLDEEEVRSARSISESPVVSSTGARPASPAQTPCTGERQLRELQRISTELFNLNPLNVAQEITRVQKGLFLTIQAGRPFCRLADHI
jgi:hypothetical protein